ncbi:hypothetical protein TL16_g00550 [Triparma laevis f. inornata]|uniref:Glutathione S-transferase n=1 Tax=Triparma laevis f. inornata TaxID=1714386 RepID=A0A9W7DSX6_9STRA|nr:hypothetical protein TL16_g00550 [Triparma laevis f. inornata]
MILEHGNIPYEDISPGQSFNVINWGECKQQNLAPFGQLPVLSVEGKGLIAQTGAIVRFCNTLVPQLTPEDPFKAAQAEAIYLAAEELFLVNRLVNVYRGDDHAQKKDEFFNDVFPRRIGNFARLLQQSGGPFTLGSAPHYGDFYLYHILSNALLVKPDRLGSDKPSYWSDFMNAVEALLGIKDYLDRRPKAVDIGVKPMLDPNICGSRVKS